MVALRARLVPHLSIRPSLLTLAPLAPLTAGAGVGNRHSPIDVGPNGAKSAPPGINRKGARPPVRLLTMVPGAHVVPGIERAAPAGIEPATGAWVTTQICSAQAVRIMSTHLHSKCERHPRPSRDSIP
jgi:hypothetical protein